MSPHGTIARVTLLDISPAVVQPTLGLDGAEGIDAALFIERSHSPHLDDDSGRLEMRLFIMTTRGDCASFVRACPMRRLPLFLPLARVSLLAPFRLVSVRKGVV